jgi:aryl-alcohol dehydrogenase-like predicted oxidoreductase
LALKFSLDHPGVATTLVGMSTRKQVDDNMQSLQLQIDPVLLAEIQKMIEPVYNSVWPSGRNENHG